MTNPLDGKLWAILRQHGSPTIGRGDVHGGHSGVIIYEPSVPFLEAAIACALADPAKPEHTGWAG